MKKNITILGSTGSIGVNTLNVINVNLDKFNVVGLSAYTNVETLACQIEKFKPLIVSVKDEHVAIALRKRVSLKNIKVFTGSEGLITVAGFKQADISVIATSGSSGLFALLEAIKRKKTIALANKEPMVMAGEIITTLARKNNVRIIPIDSEHSAILQCLNAGRRKELKKIYLTASGGPFYKLNKASFKNIKRGDALNHPRWKMGKKITIDSATMMNKGLEVIEAKWLFQVPVEAIEVLIHPEAIIHSMVEFIDGTIIAQLGVTDMRLPIQYALTYPERVASRLDGVDFNRVKTLTFAKPDMRKFPCLEIARVASGDGGIKPAVLNAANEVLVDMFLREKIKFIQIPEYLSRVINKCKNIKKPTLDEIIAADYWARKETEQLCLC